jgi:hypothetical protein
VTGRDPQIYLRAADDMLTGKGQLGSVAIVEGWWPKACACLIRLALETGITAFWDIKVPEIAACRRHRVQLLMLRRYATVDLARHSSFTWAELSRMTHYECHDPAPAAVELRRLHIAVATLIADLARAV